MADSKKVCILPHSSITCKLEMMDEEKAEVHKSFAQVFNDSISFTPLNWLNCKTGDRGAELLPREEKVETP